MKDMSNVVTAESINRGRIEKVRETLKGELKRAPSYEELKARILKTKGVTTDGLKKFNRPFKKPKKVVEPVEVEEESPRRRQRKPAPQPVAAPVVEVAKTDTDASSDVPAAEVVSENNGQE